MGRIKPKIVSKLMDVANRFADGEDVYHNKITQSPEDDRLDRYMNQRRRSRNYDNYSSHSQVSTYTRKTIIKERSAKTMGTATMTKTIRVTIGSSGQEPRETTINHPKICSTDRAICTTPTSMEKESQIT
jgi:hypothetical protein